MSWLKNPFRSNQSQIMKTLCTLKCSSCGHAFEVGINASLFTDEQVASSLRDAEMAVPVSCDSTQPDLVQQVTLVPDLIKQTEDGLLIVAKALSCGKKRLWTCGQCKAVNPYPGYSAYLEGGVPKVKTYLFTAQNITDPEEQFTMGCSFLNGENVPKNNNEAAKWFRKAADQGHREAQFCVAVNYHGGRGVIEDQGEAYQWYLKAAEQGHAAAQRTVGIAFLNGEVLQQNIGEGVRWMKKAADQGDKGALYNLGICYYNGQGVQQDDGQALTLFQRAATTGHEGAAQVLKQLGAL